MSVKKNKIFKYIIFLLLMTSFVLMVSLPLTIGVVWKNKYMVEGGIYNEKYHYLAAKYEPFWYFFKNDFDGHVIYDSLLFPFYILFTLFSGIAMSLSATNLYAKNYNLKKYSFILMIVCLLISFIMFDTFSYLLQNRTSGKNNKWVVNDFKGLKQIAYDEMEHYCKIELDPTSDMVSHPLWDSIRIYNLSISRSSISATTIVLPEVFVCSSIISIAMYISLRKFKK